VVIEQTRGKWICEIAELGGLNKREVEQVKAFLSRQTDSARAAYGRITEHVDRSFICVGTTNSDKYLRDLSGNRRFWPVKVGKVDLKKLKKDRDQLWGEAAALEATGEGIRLDPTLWGAAAEAQADRQVANPFADVLAKALEEVEAGRIAKADVYRLAGLQTAQLHQGNLELIGDAMRVLGWTSATPTINGKKARGFVKGPAHDRPALETYWSEVERCFKVLDPASTSARFVKPGTGTPEPAQGADGGEASAEQGKAPEPTTVH
jgi:predicted P-loop ATPase